MKGARRLSFGAHYQMQKEQDVQAQSDVAAYLRCWGGSGSVGSDDSVPKIILICEHASNRVEQPWEHNFDEPSLLSSHAASDLGALGLSYQLGSILAQTGEKIELIHAPLSRLIYDLNRSPDRIDACPEKTEFYQISFNRKISPEELLARVELIYLPFHNFVRKRVARALALGGKPFIITIHSFSPTWFGTPRDVEFGVIHDALPALAYRIIANSSSLGLLTELNAPYSAEDHVTHTLKLHALPYGLENAMIELRNDLLATPEAQLDVAQRLAPILLNSIQDILSKQVC